MEVLEFPVEIKNPIKKIKKYRNDAAHGRFQEFTDKHINDLLSVGPKSLVNHIQRGDWDQSDGVWRRTYGTDSDDLQNTTMPNRFKFIIFWLFYLVELRGLRGSIFLNLNGTSTKIQSQFNLLNAADRFDSSTRG